MTDQSEMAEAIDMIRRSAQGIAPRDDLSRIRRTRYDEPGFDAAVWTEMCQLGWPLLRLSEDDGGVGLPIVAYVALAEELGAALVPEPLIPAVVSAALLPPEDLASHVEGDRLILPAWQDTLDSAQPTQDVTLRDGRLHATKRFIPTAAAAEAFLVMGVDQHWLVAADAPGCSLSIEETQDGSFFGTLTLAGAEGVPVARTAAETSAALAEACLATAGYLLGLADACLAHTADFLKTRVQFGKPLSSFQALQHRMVDLKLEAELARASVWDAATRWDREGANDATMACISRAKARASDTAMLVTRSAIQLHGGIGYTDEHDIGLFLRKAMVVAPQYGSARFHQRRYAALAPLQEAN